MSIMSMLLGSGGTFTPLSLFAAGEQGVWYDPSNLASMFEDTAGTTPVHTPGNGVADSPVALLLDNHNGAVGTNGAAAYNLATYTDDFSNGAWQSYGAGKAASTLTANSSAAVVYQTLSSVSSGTYQVSYQLKAGTNNFAFIGFQKTTNVYASIVFDLANGVVGETQVLGSGWSVTSTSITSQGSGWYLCKAVVVVGSSTPYATVGLAPLATGNSWDAGGNALNNVTGRTISVKNADYRLNSQAALTPTYQPITSSWVATMAGNHATQSTSTARPTLSALYNQLQRTEDFSNSYYTKDFASVVVDQTTAPDGTTTADLFKEDSSNNYHRFYRQNSFVSGSSTTLSICAKAKERSWISLNIQDSGNHYCWFDVGNGVLGTIDAGATASITSLGNGWYRCSMTRVLNVASPYLEMRLATGNNVLTYQGDGTSGLYLWGMDWRYTNDGVGLPAYQRVADANTYDSTGFPYYLKSDGVDDYLRVSSLDMTSTNKVGLFTAIRVLADTDTQLINDFNSGGASGQFVFYYKNPTYGSDLYYGGTSQVNLYSNAALPSPIGKVFTSTGDISAPLGLIRQNGTQVASTTASVGTGNFGNGILDLFARGNSFRLSGRMYGHIFRGAASTATEISNTEAWLNNVAKIY